jgi:tetrapyrrole methylase family protein / MazG family protein
MKKNRAESKVEKPRKTASSNSKDKPLSPLAYAHALSRRASRLGFDWPDLSAVLEKLDEEIEELKRAVPLQDRARISEEIGDLFFVLVNIARFLRIDPEKALMGTLKKFRSRFRYIETSLRKAGKSFRQSNMVEMDRLWEEAKRRKKRGLR